VLIGFFFQGRKRGPPRRLRSDIMPCKYFGFFVRFLSFSEKCPPLAGLAFMMRLYFFFFVSRVKTSRACPLCGAFGSGCSFSTVFWSNFFFRLLGSFDVCNFLDQTVRFVFWYPKDLFYPIRFFVRWYFNNQACSPLVTILQVFFEPIFFLILLFRQPSALYFFFPISRNRLIAKSLLAAAPYDSLPRCLDISQELLPASHVDRPSFHRNSSSFFPSDFLTFTRLQLSLGGSSFVHPFCPSRPVTPACPPKKSPPIRSSFPALPSRCYHDEVVAILEISLWKAWFAILAAPSICDFFIALYQSLDRSPLFDTSSLPKPQYVGQLWL